jgi:hypothetical protein
MLAATRGKGGCGVIELMLPSVTFRLPMTTVLSPAIGDGRKVVKPPLAVLDSPPLTLLGSPPAVIGVLCGDLHTR